MVVAILPTEKEILAQWGAALRQGDYERLYYWAVVADTMDPEGIGRKILQRSVLYASTNLHVAYPTYVLELVRRLLVAPPLSDTTRGNEGNGGARRLSSYHLNDDPRGLCWLSGIIVFAPKTPPNRLVKMHNVTAEDIVASLVDEEVERLVASAYTEAHEPNDTERTLTRLLSRVVGFARAGETHCAMRWFSAMVQYVKAVVRASTKHAPPPRMCKDWVTVVWHVLLGVQWPGLPVLGRQCLRALSVLHTLATRCLGVRTSAQQLPMVTHALALVCQCGNARFDWTRTPLTTSQMDLIERALNNHGRMYDRVRARMSEAVPPTPLAALRTSVATRPAAAAAVAATATPRPAAATATRRPAVASRRPAAPASSTPWDAKMDIVDALDPNMKKRDA